LLTFDDGPDLRGTSAVLAELDRRGLKGVFFVSGHRMLGRGQLDVQRRELARRLATHGHLVANHTVNHRNLCREPDSVATEVDLNSDLITYATGVRPLLFRSPYGARCRRLDEALEARDLIQVGWNIDPQDWKGDTEEQITEYVIQHLRRLEGPGILLLHDTHPQAVRALPRILDWIEADNRRARREGGVPLRIVDYSVLLPASDLPETGLEPLFARLAQALPAL
jgi:peptidoglycan-N-acetylglucosamine deacetylase